MRLMLLPMPVRATLLMPSLVFMVSVPERKPVAVGLNTTLMVQSCTAGCGGGITAGQLFVCEKSPPLMEIWFTCRLVLS